MHDDFLWDQTGDLDAQGAQMLALQRTLAPLRYEPEPLRFPFATSQPQRPSSRFPWRVPALAAAAAAVLVLALRSSPSPPEATVVLVSAQEPDSSASESNVGGPQPSPAQVLGADASAAAEGARAPKRPSAARARPAQVPKPSSTPPKRARAVKPSRRTAPAGPGRRRSQGKPARPDSTRRSVDCILDPTGCENGTGRKPSSRSGDKAPRIDCILDPQKCESLPETLSSSDVRTGMFPIKSRVHACGRKHGAVAGDKVKVRLSILGSTGHVFKASTTGALADTPLGRCVAKAASKARFPRFKRTDVGVIYPFTMPAAKARRDPSDSAAELMQQVSARANVKARGCALAHDIPSGTRVDLQVKVSTAGKVTRVRVQPREPLSADATRCLKAAVGKIVVSPSATGVDGRIPLSL